MRPLVAHCHFGLSKLYRRTGKHERPHKHVATATMMYRDTDMTNWLEQAGTAIRQLQLSCHRPGITPQASRH